MPSASPSILPFLWLLRLRILLDYYYRCDCSHYLYPTTSTNCLSTITISHYSCFYVYRHSYCWYEWYSCYDYYHYCHCDTISQTNDDCDHFMAKATAAIATATTFYYHHYASTNTFVFSCVQGRAQFTKLCIATRREGLEERHP